MDFGGRKREVPVAGEGFGGGEGGVAVVDGGDCKGGVAAEDEGGEVDC